MDRLTPLATAFLDAEDVDARSSTRHRLAGRLRGTCTLVRGVRRADRRTPPAHPALPTEAARVPFGLAAPAWVDDPHFDLRWHVRNTALPAPGGREEIGRLMSRVMSRRMNRDRPLWEYWFCEGLPDGRWALLSKLHHSLVDGVSGTDLYQLVLDPTPTPRPAVPDTWAPADPPSTTAARRRRRGSWPPRR